MNKQHTIYLFGILTILTFTLIACEDEDDPQPTPETTNGFTYNNTFYATANAYFEIDEDDDNLDGKPDNYAFFFTDGNVFDNDISVNGTSDEYLLSMNSTNFVGYFLNESLNPGLGTVTPSAGITYNGDLGDAQIWHGFQMNSFNPSFSSNGIEFGTVVGTGTQHVYGPPAATITVNAINIDLVNTGANTMDVDYSYTNASGELITGHYEGSMGLIFD